MEFHLPALECAAPKPVAEGKDGNRCANILGTIALAAVDRRSLTWTEWLQATVNLVKPSVGVEGMRALESVNAVRTEKTDGKSKSGDLGLLE